MAYGYGDRSWIVRNMGIVIMVAIIALMLLLARCDASEISWSELAFGNGLAGF